MTKTVMLEVAGKQIAITHPDKIYFPARNGYQALSKLDLARYCQNAAKALALYSKDRALFLHRFPEGIAAGGFFQKRIKPWFPDWMAHKVLPLKDGTLDYVLGGQEAAFVWLANIGAIELHALLARADKPKRPDMIIFDLDPPVDYTDEVRQTALEIKALCDRLGLGCFVKSTGSRGFHIIIPIARRYTFERTRAYAKAMAGELIQARPDRLSLDMRKAKRSGRILIDVWRNGFGQSAVLPLSVRARPGGPVAVPLRWQDLQDKTIHPRTVTIANFDAHKARAFSAWKDWPGKAQTLPKLI